MALQDWSATRDMFRKWRDNNERQSEDVVYLWEAVLEEKVAKLGTEKFLVLEQVCVAALDRNRLDIARKCIKDLSVEFPNSLRVAKYKAMVLEAQERYEDAIKEYDAIIEKDKTSSAPRKRKIAIYKARGKYSEAIKELTEYLKLFMSDQEAWIELCELYLTEHEYTKAAFCAEELILHNPYNHLMYQRYADIKYTHGGHENVELAKSYYCQALKLNPNSVRALYGLYLSLSSIAQSQKAKKKDVNKLVQWTVQQIQKQYSSAGTDTELRTVVNAFLVSQ